MNNKKILKRFLILKLKEIGIALFCLIGGIIVCLILIEILNEIYQYLDNIDRDVFVIMIGIITIMGIGWILVINIEKDKKK